MIQIEHSTLCENKSKFIREYVRSSTHEMRLALEVSDFSIQKVYRPLNLAESRLAVGSAMNVLTFPCVLLKIKNDTRQVRLCSGNPFNPMQFPRIRMVFQVVSPCDIRVGDSRRR